MNEERRKKVCIVVVGDVGRSPRMQYHALSFLKEGYDVELVGYRGSNPTEQLLQHNNFKLNYIIACPNFKDFLPSGLAHAVKVLWQIITILFALLISNSSDYILVQNPPAVPVLGVCYLYCKMLRSKFIIDWHNYGYTILALSLGDKHILVRVSKWFEFYFGKRSYANLCVTRAMKDDLEIKNIKATVFYDRPPHSFRKTTLMEKHALFMKLGAEHDIFLKDCSSNETIFTKCLPNSDIVLREDRPAFIVSSTSWTQDEDFSILLSALEEYEKVKCATEELPHLVCAITGKGPLKDFYKNIIERRNWKYVTISTPWLEAEDYPTFIGCADFGVSLHRSSSGLDLPMKVVDMFGCCVPVCAVKFNCIEELVKHNENGLLFSDSTELFEQMKLLLHGFHTQEFPLLAKLKKNVEEFRSFNWHDNWNFTVKPVFQH